MPNIGPKRRMYDFRYPASDISTEEDPSNIFTDEEHLPSNTSVEDNMLIEDEIANENVFSPTRTIYSYTTTSDEDDEDERLETLRTIQDNIASQIIPSLDTSIEIESTERNNPQTPSNDSATTVHRLKTLASPRVIKVLKNRYVKELFFPLIKVLK